MEELKNIKLNTEELPEVPRTAEGEIDLEAIATGKTEKGKYIVPDEVMKAYYKELPNGTVNTSRTFTAYNGGLLQSLNDEIRRKGNEAVKSEWAQRRKLSETIDIMLRKKATNEEIEALGLEAGATKQDALIAAMMIRAIDMKDVQAFNSLRDTAGEKPSDKISAEITQLTAEDREMLQRVQARLDSM